MENVGMLLGCCALLTACAVEDTSQGTPVRDRVVLENDDAVLAERVQYTNKAIELIGMQAANAALLELTLVAQIEPPEVLGHDVGGVDSDGSQHEEGHLVVPLLATSVAGQNETLVVSYSRIGRVYAGGIDVIDTHEPDKPRLRSFAHFEHIDVNAATFVGAADPQSAERGDGYLFASASTCDPEYYPWTAVVEQTQIIAHKLTLDDSYRFGVYGQSGTSVASNGSLMLAGGGLDGAVSVLDHASKERLLDLAVPDVRWVDMDDSRGVILVGNNAGDGSLQVIDLVTLETQFTVALTGVNQLDSKNSVEIVDDRAYVAAGPAGMHVVDLTTGELIATIPVLSRGYDSFEEVTNSVSVSEGLIFMGNGAAGVAVYEADDLTFRGYLDLAGSVNHVKYHKGMLYIAGGSEGLLIVRVKQA